MELGGASVGSPVSQVEYRRAAEADLPAVADVWFQDLLADEPDVPFNPEVIRLFRHELETGEMWVAERGSRVAGFSSSIVRGPVRFLSNLFLRPESRNEGIGRRLLERAMPDDGLIASTTSSRDPRAIALYARHGITPRWPHFILRGDRGVVTRIAAGRFPQMTSDQAAVVEVGTDDREAIQEMDAQVGGRPRPADHELLMEAHQAIPLWFEQERRRLGYGYVQLRTPWWLSDPGAATVGPVGVLEASDAVACVWAAVEWAVRRRPSVFVSLLGPHPALGPLLEVGFRIEYVELFMCSSEEPFADPHRYVASGSELF